jgi:hypothetical protein
MWDFVMDESGVGAGFLRELRFPLPICIPPISPQSLSPIIRGLYNRPVVAAVPKVPPHKLKKNWCRACDGKELNSMEGRDGNGSPRTFVLNMQIKNTADVSL